MVTIKLHNTKTRAKDVFTPIDPKNVRMYVCGPTVYDRAHLGNARPVVVFDVLYRLLRYVYGPDHVTYVRNFTDVDDKINAEALRRQQKGAPGTLEELIAERTEETISWYHADMDALGALRPNHEPRATQFIDEMKDMIQILIDKGNAYVVHDGSNNPPHQYVLFDRETRNATHTLFDVESYPPYGQLSGQSAKQMIAGSRGEKAPHKRNPTDFVLWKPSSDQEPGWDSPWGRGRPGWHIECSAMAHKLLGESFDIHAGGIDLLFPHHENELAQSTCAHPHGGFANVWMHNEMLQVEGKKMSKSLGNFFTVRDLLDQGVPGEVIRFVLLGTHYGKPMDWTKEKVNEAQSDLGQWRAFTRDLAPTYVAPEVIEVLANDLNTSGAITALRALAKAGRFGELKASAGLLGMLEMPEEDWSMGYSYAPKTGKMTVLLAGSAFGQDWLEILLKDQLRQARTNKDFERADTIRNGLVAAGVRVVLSTDSVELTAMPNFDPKNWRR